MEGVSVETQVGITTVTFGHPKANSLPRILLTQLTAAIATAAKDSATRVIVIRSAGEGSFCAGASFDEVRTISDPVQGADFFQGFADLILAMVRAPQPVVVRAQGKAVGGGVGIIAAADYAFGTGKTELRLSELAVGLGPFVVGPVIARRIGSSRMNAMALDTEWRSAQWGVQCGLLHKVVPDLVTLDGDIAKLAATIAAYPAQALAGWKRAVWEDTANWETLLHARAVESGRIAALHQRSKTDAPPVR